MQPFAVALHPGTRLGPYEIADQIGKGGMGEVYRAFDTNLGRQVAIKILPDPFAHDPERLARFAREAKTLASLNHPNIAQIYGLEKRDGTTALVIELVDGPTLADRIAQGSLPVDEVLPIAKQMAEALEAAHEQGIIHRDLKPANIKLRPNGTVKVLDFGLAKAIDARPEGRAYDPPGLSQSPTITTPAMTQLGVILGTAAYMSPEQAKGRAADKRSDMWAFGCVVYEMLTGKRAFDGEDVSDTLAAVLRGAPEWTALPAGTPAPLRTLLRRCLEKDRKKRLADAADARLDIEDALTTPAAEVPPALAPRRVVPVAIASVVAGALMTAITMWVLMRPAPRPARVERFVIPTPADASATSVFGSALAMSPDGSRVVYRTLPVGAADVIDAVLYLRDRGQLEPTLLPGTEGATGPVFSPDGEWIAFQSLKDQTLKRVSVLGGAPQTICSLDGLLRGASWGPDNTIIFATSGTKGLRQVAAAAGEPQVLTKIDETTGETDHILPEVLPAGQGVLFTAWNGTPERSHIAILSLPDRHVSTLVSGGTSPRFAPSGHLVFAVGGTLRAVRFDPARLAVIGTSIPVLEGVRMTEQGAAHYALSSTGSLVYVPGPVGSTATGAVRTVAFIDRKGAAEPLKLQPAAYQMPRLSPDGTRIAVGSDDGKEATIWVYELSGASAARPLTLEGHNRFPVWSADSQRVTFQSDREKDLGLFWQRADGTGPAQRLAKADQGTSYIPEAWSPDGTRLLYTATGKDSMAVLWVLKEGKAERFDAVASPWSGTSGALPGAVFSPNGKWVAYASGDIGRMAVYVQPFPPTGAIYRISKSGDNGHHPLWSPDGKELFFTPGPSRLSVVNISTQPAFSFTEAVALTDELGTRGPTRGPWYGIVGAPFIERQYDISRDGRRFLGVIETTRGARSEKPEVAQIRMVFNWTEELKAKFPTK